WNRPAAFADGSSNKMAWYEWAANSASPASKVGTVATPVAPPLARSISATPCAKRASLPTSKTFSGSNSMVRFSPRRGARQINSPPWEKIQGWLAAASGLRRSAPTPCNSSPSWERRRPAGEWISPSSCNPPAGRQRSRIPLSRPIASKYPACLKHHARCFHQNLRLPDERTRQRSRRRPARGQGLHPRAIRGGRRRDFAEYLQRARFRGAKGDWQNAKHRGGCAQAPSGGRARFHGLHGAKPRTGTY